MNMPACSTRSPSPTLTWGPLAVTGVAWILAYANLENFADAGTGLLGLDTRAPLGDAVHFFLADTPKVLLLLTLIVFLMGVVHTFVSPEKTRALLAGRREGVGNVMAAALGIVTPFCSCSAVSLFIGFLSAGIPLGVTLSFLISAPMVNEIALALLFGMFGWKVAALYTGLGLTVAIAAGLIIGRLGMEHHLEDWVREALKTEAATAAVATRRGWPDRLAAGRAKVKNIVGKVWPWIIAGIAVGAGIHGWVPQDFMASFMGKDAPWWSVPAAVALGVPMYSNAAGIIPIVEALMSKGAAMGTVLAFMMSVIALSLPEFVILRRVLKWPLIATFAGVVASGILLVGYVFNWVL
jgi:hypothetical protein